MSEKKVEKKSSVVKKILIIILVLVIAGGSGFGGYLFANKRNASKPVNERITIESDEKRVNMGEFLVNLCDKNERRYFKSNIYLGYPEQNKELLKELQDKENVPKIRDVINLFLMSKKSSEITHENIQKLKKELILKINDKLIQGKITNVYFNDIIVQ